jgi:lipoprotein signal peptidase
MAVATTPHVRCAKPLVDIDTAPTPAPAGRSHGLRSVMSAWTTRVFLAVVSIDLISRVLAALVLPYGQHVRLGPIDLWRIHHVVAPSAGNAIGVVLIIVAVWLLSRPLWSYEALSARARVVARRLDSLLRIGLVLAISGTIINALELFFHGYVVDFLQNGTTSDNLGDFLSFKVETLQGLSLIAVAAGILLVFIAADLRKYARAGRLDFAPGVAHLAFTAGLATFLVINLANIVPVYPDFIGATAITTPPVVAHANGGTVFNYGAATFTEITTTVHSSCRCRLTLATGSDGSFTAGGFVLESNGYAQLDLRSSKGEVLTFELVPPLQDGHPHSIKIDWLNHGAGTESGVDAFVDGMQLACGQCLFSTAPTSQS